MMGIQGKRGLDATQPVGCSEKTAIRIFTNACAINLNSNNSL